MHSSAMVLSPPHAMAACSPRREPWQVGQTSSSPRLPCRITPVPSQVGQGAQRVIEAEKARFQWRVGDLTSAADRRAADRRPVPCPSHKSKSAGPRANAISMESTSARQPLGSLPGDRSRPRSELCRSRPAAGLRPGDSLAGFAAVGQSLAGRRPVVNWSCPHAGEADASRVPDASCSTAWHIQRRGRG